MKTKLFVLVLMVMTAQGCGQAPSPVIMRGATELSILKHTEACDALASQTAGSPELAVEAKKVVAVGSIVGLQSVTLLVNGLSATQWSDGVESALTDETFYIADGVGLPVYCTIQLENGSIASVE